LSSLLHDLSSAPSTEILEGLRGLERKIGPVYQLLRSSVYSIVLQQEMMGEEYGNGEG